MDTEDTLRRELNYIVLRFLQSGDCPEIADAFRNHLNANSSSLLPQQYHWYNSRPRSTTVREIENQNDHVHNDFLFDALRNCVQALNQQSPRNALLRRHLSFLSSGESSLLRNFTDPDQNYEPPSLLKLSHHPHNAPTVTPVECPSLYPGNFVTAIAAREITGYRPLHHLLPTSHYQNYKKHRRLLGHLSSVYCLLFDHTGRYIITGADDKLVKIWSAQDGRLLMTLRGHSHEVSDLSIDPENSMIAAASCDKEIRIWRLINGAPICVLSGHQGQINNIKFCPLLKWPDKRYLVSGGHDGNVCFWQYNPNTKVFNPEPLKNNERKKGAAHIVYLTFSKGGEFMALGTSDNHLYVYHMGAAHGPTKIFETDAHLGDVDSIMFSNRSMRFVSGAKDSIAMIWRFERQTWKKTLLRMDQRLPGAVEEPTLPVADNNRKNGLSLKVSMVGWTCDDAHVITSVNDHTIKVWDSRSGELVHVLYGHEAEVFVIEGHPTDPRIFLSGGHEGAINIWDVVTGQSLQTFYNDIEGQGHGAIFECHWSPDGLMFSSVDSHGHLTFFGVGSSEPYQRMPEHAFFHTDYRPLAYDRARFALDDQNQIAPHLMDPAFLVDIDGNPYEANVQQLVPKKNETLIRPLDAGIWECTKGKLLKMAEDEAEYFEVERKKRPDAEEVVVSREENIVTRRKKRISVQCRGLLQEPLMPEDDEMDGDFAPEEIMSSTSEEDEEEAMSFNDDSDDSDFAPRAPRPQQAQQPRRPKKNRRPDDDRDRQPGQSSSSSRRNRRMIADDDDERTPPTSSSSRRNRRAFADEDGERLPGQGSSSRRGRRFAEEDEEERPTPSRLPQRIRRPRVFDDDDDEDERPARPPPQRRRKRVVIADDDDETPARSRNIPSSSANTNGLMAYPNIDELPDSYKPPEWLTDSKPKKSPYFPQIGDEVVYFRTGHQEYINMVRAKAIYTLAPNTKPFKLRGSESDAIFARVESVKYILKPQARLVELVMKVLDEEEYDNNITFKIKYHDVQNVCDFIILKEHYDKSIGREWKTGDDFRAVIDDKWWAGKILTEAQNEIHTFFQCFNIIWLSGEEENLSPWDLEPMKRGKRAPNSAERAIEGVPLTAEERAQLNHFESSEITEAERDRLLKGFIRIIEFSQSEMFNCPVDLSIYTTYAMQIAYPMDLSTIKDRIENRFYRHKEAIKSDAGYIHTNAETFNLPGSEIVEKAEIVAQVCQRFIDDVNCFDPTSILIEIQSGDNELDDDDTEDTEATESSTDVEEEEEDDDDSVTPPPNVLVEIQAHTNGHHRNNNVNNWADDASTEEESPNSIRYRPDGRPIRRVVKRTYSDDTDEEISPRNDGRDRRNVRKSLRV